MVVGIPEFPPLSSPMFVTLRPAEGSMIALQHVSTVSPGQLRPAGGFELNFEVNDVDHVFEAWSAAGVQIVTPLEDKPFGRVFTALDPEGNLLSVYTLSAN